MNSQEPTLPQPDSANGLTSPTDSTLPQPPATDEATLIAESSTAAQRLSQLGIETAVHIDRLCAEYERSCRGGGDLFIEPWLNQWEPREYPVALQELLHELEQRKRLGHTIYAND